LLHDGNHINYQQRALFDYEEFVTKCFLAKERDIVVGFGNMG